MAEENPETMEDACSNDRPDFHIAGVGASAGGLEALEEFFRSLPGNSGVAFVVVQHLAPDFKSHMQELLSRHTQMAIHRVEDGMQVEPDSIYLIPPKKEMVIKGRKLLLTDRGRDGSLSHPIDLFFRSLASDIGPYAIGIVLSGTGSDGSRGICDIHESGGLVLAQDQETARFQGMPVNAVASGVVDAELPPDGIAKALVRYVKEGLSAEAFGRQERPGTPDGGVDQIFRLLHGQYGIDFSQYKPSTVSRRIQRRLDMQRFTNIDEYVDQLNRDSGELNNLYKDLLIGVTSFFRDPEAFEALRPVIRDLFSSDRNSDAVRIWVAGCATGEEAYSLAILVDEEARKSDRAGVDIKIFATDAHQTSLNVAAKGCYPDDAFSEMSPERCDRYFRKTHDGYQVTADLRRLIVFASHNLISDAPFTQLDLVTCRNLLIYLQPAAQKKALSMIHFALKSGGTLFLGPSESPGELSDDFQVIERNWRIYTKRRDVRAHAGARMPFTATNGLMRIPSTAASGTARQVDAKRFDIYERLLAQRMPPSILVNSSYEILHVFTGATRYLETRNGPFSSGVLDTISPSLRTALAAALQHSTRTQKPVCHSGVRFSTETRVEELRIRVEPIHGAADHPDGYLIEIEGQGQVGDVSDDEAKPEVSDSDHDRISNLESDLSFAQENLQATVEEMETSNEELQAANEELIASNEELQSTNEELHSVNEELHTVNAEHQRRVEELAKANADMDNLLATTRVGVIFLDRELCIRRFTPEIARLLQLMPHDVGRPIDGFTHSIVSADLVSELQTVLATNTERELPVDDRDGRPYLARILPYQSPENTDGVVLALIDIASVKKAEAETARFKFMTEASTNPITLLNSEGAVVYCNAAMRRTLGYTAEELPRMTVPEFDTKLDAQQFAEVFEAAANQELAPFESEWQQKDGGLVPVEISISSLMIDGNRYVSAHVRDITQRLIAEQEMRMRDLAMESAMNGILITDPTAPDNPITYANPGFGDMTGYSVDEVVGRNCRFLQGADTDQDAVRQLRAAVQSGQPCRITLLNYRKDGEPFWNDLQITPIFDERKNLKHFVGVQHDVTQQVESEASIRQYADRITGILNATAEGIYGIDSHGLCTFCNATAVRLLGYDSVDDLIGQHMHELIHSRTADGELMPEDECAIYKAARTNTPVEVSSEVFWRKDGTCFPVQYRSEPIAHDGELIGAVVSFKDISEQLRTRKKLEAANRAARKANKAKSEFLANMSHELRTPMTAVLGFSEMLRSHSNDASYLEKVDTIKRNGEYLLALLNDILDLSKIEAGKMDVNSESIDLWTLIEDLRVLMTVRASEEGIPLIFEFVGEVPVRITADRIRVRQILVNLISNALKFTNTGEVRVSIGIVDHPSESPRLAIEVKDTGIGMTKEQVARLFKPFTQATSDTAREFGGTGLGLSISQQLAKRMNGVVLVESEYGTGSLFTLQLPVTAEELEHTKHMTIGSAVVVEQGGAPDTLPTLNGRILLADDRRDVWRVARFFLEKCGAQVEVAEDGRQAVDAVNRATKKGRPFDLILMDMQMPIMTGQEAVAELRQQGCRIPIIALTADAMEGERANCIAIGCDDYSPKPVDGPALMKMVAHHLQRPVER